MVQPPHSKAIHYFPFAFYLIESLGIDDCLKFTVQVPVFITNNPKCNNIVILYNTCGEVLFLLCALLYREVRALCRVQGSTGSRASLAQGHFS